MNANQAAAFVARHGIVLLAARGPVPRLTEAIAGEPIGGSWWGHPQSHAIFAVLQVLSEREDILFCRLVNGKVTLVHRRLWPALVRAAPRFSKDRLAQVHQEHTASGKHVNRDVPFPGWVPRDVEAAASMLTEAEALRALGDWVPTHD